MCGSTNLYAKFLYYLAKIFGLAPFQLMDNRLSCKSWVDEVCSIINIILFFFGIFIMAIVDLKMPTGHLSDVVANGDLFASTVKHLGIITCIVIFILQRKNIIKIVDLFFDIDGTFRSLGIVRNCEEVFKVRARFIMIWSTVLITIEITSGIVYVNAQQQTDFTSVLHHIIVKSFGNLIQHYVIVIFITVMVNVNERLELIDSSLSNARHSVQGESEICVETTSTASEIEVDFKIVNNIKKIEIVYDMLCDLIDGTIKLFSLPLLIIIAVYFSSLLIMTYRFYEIGRDFHGTENLKSLFENSIVSLTSVLMALNLFVIASVCNRTQTLASYTPDKVHDVCMEYQSTELHDELEMLSLQLLQRPLKMAAFGFFALDYSYLYKITCTVVAYLVVMVQFDSSRGKVVQKLLNQTGLNVTNE